MRTQWPTTPGGWCVYFRALDIRYPTPRDSPLHHDFRCPIHGSHPNRAA